MRRPSHFTEDAETSSALILFFFFKMVCPSYHIQFPSASFSQSLLKPHSSPCHIFQYAGLVTSQLLQLDLKDELQNGEVESAVRCTGPSSIPCLGTELSVVESPAVRMSSLNASDLPYQWSPNLQSQGNAEHMFLSPQIYFERFASPNLCAVL